MMHFSISASSSLKLMKYLYKAHMKAWYVLKGASVDFLGTEPFPGNMLSELCPMTSSMNSWSRNTTWPYAAICSSTDCKQLYNRSKPQIYRLHRSSSECSPHHKVFLSDCLRQCAHQQTQ